MDKTPNLGLHLTPEGNNQKRFITYRTELSGDQADSNMMILDTKVKEIIDALSQCQAKVFTWGDLKKEGV